MSFLGSSKAQNSVVPTTASSTGNLPALRNVPKQSTLIDESRIDGDAGWTLDRSRKVKPETEATEGFTGMVRNYLQKMRENGQLRRYPNYDDLANFLTSQMDVQSSLETLLYKKSAGVEGNAVAILWFDMAPEDPLAPLMKAIIESHAHKVLPPTSNSKIAKFRVDFLRRAKPKVEKQAQLPSSSEK